MGAMIGFVLGYWMGVKAGPNGYEELMRAWRTISSSEEIKDMLAGGLAALGDALKQGRAILAERLAPEETPRIRAA